jgi:hypothetical protein
LIDFPTISASDPSKLALLKEVSRELLKVLEQQESQLAIKYESNFPSLPTLAGLLLSYPAIYYPEDSTAKVTDAEVDIYSICTNSPDRQTILQFSAPTTFRQEVTHDVDILAEEWDGRVSRLSPLLSQKWEEYTGVESCTLKTQVETRRVSILTL